MNEEKDIKEASQNKIKNCESYHHHNHVENGVRWES